MGLTHAGGMQGEAGGAPSIVGFPHSRRYTAQGTYSDESAAATLELFETGGGIFTDPADVCESLTRQEAR